MGCTYCDFNGKCDQFDPDLAMDGMGYDDDGNCVVEDDLDPAMSCEGYESTDEEDEEDEEFSQGDELVVADDELEVEETNIKFRMIEE